MTTVEEIQKKLKSEITKLNVYNQTYEKLSEDRVKLETQMSQNSDAYNDLVQMPENTKVFKRIGPALIKQDIHEAIKTIKDRINFIEKNIEALILKFEEVQSNQKTSFEAVKKLEMNLSKYH